MTKKRSVREHLQSPVCKVVKKGKTILVTKDYFDKEPPLWADKEGKLNLDGVGLPPEGGLTVVSADKQSESSSPHWLRQQPEPKKKTQQSSLSSLSRDWRLLKSLDIVTFNKGAEDYFVLWLKAKLAEQEFGCVTIGWLLSNAAFELDVSIETVKRYLMKHTADRAEFQSDGKVISAR